MLLGLSFLIYTIITILDIEQQSLYKNYFDFLFNRVEDSFSMHTCDMCHKCRFTVTLTVGTNSTLVVI